MHEAGSPGLMDGHGCEHVDFKPVSRGLLSDDVVSEIRRLLVAERLRPGDKLPSERDLAQALKVSRSVVRDAVQRLTALGVLELRRGTGTFISNSVGRRSDQAAIISQALSNELPDLLEALAHIECGLAGLAAERAGASDRDAIEKAMRGAALDECQVWSLVDQAARSSVLADLRAGLGAQVLSFASGRGGQFHPNELMSELHAILSAVLGGRPMAAREAADHRAAIRKSRFIDRAGKTEDKK
ncbi:GntR family transcriptional regulator [Enterovirga sp.]|uniref:FadR/GntR family transcriptional regulator n=1 Tax=Enterovirga sp. TaxID=2026350 RepID=UPI002CA84EA4|nr:GntR family transcriptional regulator [Enterovirga sp.]HMO27811.1 GntR family transcriptional regulator [Enterovirga sp.]